MLESPDETDSQTHAPTAPPVAPSARKVLGPLVFRVPCGGLEDRLMAAVLFLACAGLLGVAGYLKPSPGGVGTHTQLGLSPCTMIVWWGIPCPTCGMTTAFAHTVRGEWLAAIHAQPAGWLAAIATAVLGAAAASTVVTGRKWRLNWYRLAPWRVALVIVAIVLAAWAYRIGVTVGWF